MHTRREDITEAFPAFATIVIMPFTYSISNGVLPTASLHVHLVGTTNGLGSASTHATCHAHCWTKKLPETHTTPLPKPGALSPTANTHDRL